LKEKNDLQELFVEVTNRCLLSCVHCSSCAGPNIGQSIPLEKVVSMIDQTIPLGLRSFTVSGGEPFLYPDLFRLLTYAKERGLILGLYTCGVIGTSRSLESLNDEFINKLFELKIDKLIFSLQGGNSQIHDSVTGIAGSFNITVQSIIKSVKCGLPVELHFVPMKINYQEIESIVKLAHQLGVKKVSLLRLVPQGRCDENLTLSSLEGIRVFDDAKTIRQLYPEVYLRFGAPFDCLTFAGVGCSASKSKLLISALGEAFPCEAFKFLRGTRPSIHKSTIKYIWETDKLLNDLRILKKENLKHCNSCNLLSKCEGGCPGQRMLVNGDIKNGPDPWCLVHSIIV